MKIGWILSGDENLGSSRITAINVHNYFTANKVVESHILYKPFSPTDHLAVSETEIKRIVDLRCDLLILQKVQHGLTLRLIEEARKKKIKIILMMCDQLIDRCFAAVDGIIVFSDYHKEHLVPYIKKVHVAFGAYENAPIVGKQHLQTAQLRVVSFGGHCSAFPRWFMKCIRHMGHIPVGIGFTPKIGKRLTEMSGCYNKWHRDTLSKELLLCDVGIIFASENGPSSLYKSPNRIVQLMSLGVPVIADPIPSYQNILSNGKNGFLACSRRDWRKNLEMLCSSAEYRQKIGDQARADVLERFSLHRQSMLYIEIFEKILSEKE